MKKIKVLITTVPFGDRSRLPLELLENDDVEYVINPLNRKLTEDDLCELVSDFDVIIAGTEIISAKVMARAQNLKFISRVGIGLDGVDLNEARRLGIKVSYTPDAPAPAVAELTFGLMLSLLRNTHVSNSQMHKREWQRHFGRRIPEVTIGIIGTGRIGSRIIRRTKSFGTPQFYANDLLPNHELDKEHKIIWADKEEIYKKADVISIHLPLTRHTKNMIR